MDMMTPAASRAIVLAEPQMEFGGGQTFEYPAIGLTLFGPVEGGNIERPRHMTHAVIGTPDGIAKFEDFAKLLGHPISSPKEMRDEIWPFYPGFEEAFGASFDASSPFTENVDARELHQAVNLSDDHRRVCQVTELYLSALKVLARKDAAIQFAICVVPEIVFKNCRPQSKVFSPIKLRPNSREIRLRRQMQDFFGGYDSEQYDYSLDFRKQLKARTMECKIPVQIVRESTLRLTDENTFGQRGLTPLSDRAWNLSTAMFYKSGAKPWKLPDARPGVCYVGIAYKRTDDRSRTACSAAQMFLNDGDGIVFMGDIGPWYSPDTKQCHLTRDAARRLLKGVLETYEQEHGHTLTEVFLHCRSRIDEDEWKGFLEACPVEVKLVGIRVAPESRGFRAYRTGTRPVVRGTFWPVSNRVGYLWASGFKPALRTYDGFDVPEPLRIEVQHGNADLLQVAKDIFALTKLNYNACKLGESQPVTVHFSDAVGEILVANQGTKHFLPNFKYYV